MGATASSRGDQTIQAATAAGQAADEMKEKLQIDTTSALSESTSAQSASNDGSNRSQFKGYWTYSDK